MANSVINKSGGLKAGLLLSVFALPLIMGPALAQSNLPGSVEPGRVPDAPIEEPEEELDFSFSIELDGGQTPAPGTEEDELDFEGLSLIGATRFTLEELRPLWQEFEGQSITFSQLFELTGAITRHYKQAGYETSYAFFEPQESEDGVFALSVVEGYVGEVDVEGDMQASAAVRRLLEGLLGQKPIKTAEFERVALLVNDLPGVRGTLVLGPSSAGQGASRVVMKVTHIPYSGTIGIDNHGTKFAGKRQASTSLTLNSPLGFGESITIGGSLADPVDARRESQALNLSATLPIGGVEILPGLLPAGRDGSKLKAGFSISESIPGHTLSALGIQSSSRSMNLGWEAPFIRSRDETLSLDIDLAISESRTVSQRNTAAETELSEDSLRAVTFKANYRRSGLFGGVVTSGSLALTQSLNRLLGGSEPSNSPVSRVDADRDFTFLKGDVTHIHRLAPRTSLLVNGSAQLARTPLFASHEFGVGGQGIGRGFDSSEITGDHGISGLAEVRYDVASANFDLIHPEVKTWMPGLQLYAFYDVGRIHNINADNNAATQQSLASTGFGFRTSLRYNARFNVEVVKPLVGVVASQGNSTSPRMFMHLTWAF